VQIRVRFHAAVFASALTAFVSIASADETPTAASVVSQPAFCLLRADREVHLRLLESIASNTHKHGDRFALEVIEPVTVDGAIVIPAGAKGEGEVVHAAKSGFGGRGGELILASRFVRVGDQQIKLRSFSAGSGNDRVNLALGLSYVFVGIFVTGKEISLSANTNVFAKVAVDTSLPSFLIPVSETNNETSQR